MDKKEWLAPVFIFLLSACFIAVCVGVFLSRGKLAKWINLKMKIGGLLLSLTAVSCSNETNDGISCYLVNIEINKMAVTMPEVIELIEENVFFGGIKDKHCDKFSFALYNRHFQKVQLENISILPHDENDSIIYFNISIDSTLKSGKYFISLYDADTSKQNLSNRKYNNSIFLLNDAKVCLKLKAGEPLVFRFTNSRDGNYSYNIVDEKGRVLQTGKLNAEKSFYNRHIFVKLDDNISVGSYCLNIYNTDISKQNGKSRIASYKIDLKL